MTKDFGQLTINPKDPSGEPTRVWFPGDLTLGLYKNDPVAFQNLSAAKYVLENPLAIYEGIRDYTPGGYCYVGRPEMWHVKENVVATFPARFLFCVFVNSRMYAYAFRAELAEDIQNSEGRFKNRLWPLTS